MKTIYTLDLQKEIIRSIGLPCLIFHFILIAMLLLPGFRTHAQCLPRVDEQPEATAQRIGGPIQSAQTQAPEQGVSQVDVGGALTINGSREDEVQYKVINCGGSRNRTFNQSLMADSFSSRIKGKITDDKGEGLINATVVIIDAQGKSTGKGTVTDFDGNYELRVAPGTYNIKTSYVGFSPQVIKAIQAFYDRPTCLSIKLQFATEYCCHCCYYCYSRLEEVKEKEEEAAPTPTLRACPVPLSASITLEYTVKDAEEASISLIDIEGRTVSILMEQQRLEEGDHKDVFSLPASLPSGVYFIAIKKASGDQVLKVVK